MKKISEIEELTPEQMELIASDATVPVPEDLKASLEALTGAAEAAGILEKAPGEGKPAARDFRRGAEASGAGRNQEAGRGASWQRWAIAAAAATLVALTATLAIPSRPKDTFSDPLLAYAEVQRTFDRISSHGEQAMEIAGKAVPVMEKTDEIIKKVIK